MQKKKKHEFLKCINGVKGAISLFMAVLMTPFLTIALMLVETGRYNSAVSILDEAMGVSAISTLANYDTYLQDRWGLMSVDQDVDISTVFNDYLDTNVSVMGDSINVNSASVKGLYPLSSLQTLENQIMEFSKLNVPTKIGMELGNVTDWINKLEKMMGSFGDVLTMLTNGIEVADAATTLIRSAVDLKESANKLDQLKSEYETSYSAFESAINALIGKLKEIETVKQQIRELEDQKERLEKELRELEGEKNTEPTEEQTDPSDPTETTAPPETTEPPEDSEEVKAKKKEIDETDRSLRNKKSELHNLEGSISGLRTAANNAKTTYAETLGKISSELTNYQTLMQSCSEAITEIQNKVISAVAAGAECLAELSNKRNSYNDLKKEIKEMEEAGVDKTDAAYLAKLDQKIKLEEEIAALETEKAKYDAYSKGVGEMSSELNTTLETYSDALIGELAKGFRLLQEKVQGLNTSTITSSTPYITRDEYKSVQLAGYVAADEIDKYLLEQEKEMKEGEWKAFVDGLLSLYDALMGISVFCENGLSAVLDVKYYNETIGGLPGQEASNGILAVLTSLGNVLASAGSLVANIVTFNVLEAWQNLTALLENFKSLGVALINLMEEIFNALSALFDYKSWYLAAYCTYMLPCRTDFNSKVSMATMVGNPIGSNLPTAPTNVNIPVVGSVLGLVETIRKYMDDGGKDKAFYGAELEYMLYGSNSEVANQLYVFCAIYLVRVLLCAGSIQANAEVQALAASTTLGYPVVMALYHFLEPLVQTILLVNGSNQELVPTTIYLSPSGLPKLVAELIHFCKLTEAKSESITKGMLEASDVDMDQYKAQLEVEKGKVSASSSLGNKIGSFLKFSYREYCMVMMLLTVQPETRLQRLMNLIQTEGTYYYLENDAGVDFNLKNCYTYLELKVDADLNQIMPSLLDSSFFSVTREQYRGY